MGACIVFVRLTVAIGVFAVPVAAPNLDENPTRTQNEDSPRSAHHWYPRECCQQIDCAPLNRKDILSAQGGWYIRPSRETIPYFDSRVRSSPDGQFHRCIEEFWEPSSRTRCLFVPRFESS